MSLRPVELEQVVAEVAEHLTGAVAQKAWCPLPRLAYVELRVPGRSILLCLCAEGDLARVSVAEERFPTPGEPAPFQRWLRQELTGFKLQGACFMDAARVVAFDFVREDVRRRLILEVGAPGGLLLLSDNGRVLMLSGEGFAQRRGLHPGAAWTPPEPPPPEAREKARSQPSRLAPQDSDALPYSQAAERLLGARDKASRSETIRRRLAQPYRARLKRASRTLEKVRAEAARGPDAEKHREVGELLAQNLYRLKRGATEAVLTAYTEEGAKEVRVTLDPKRTPKEEADWRFHQYRRLLRGVEQARHREAELAREVAHAQEALAQLERMEDAALLSQAEVLQLPSGGEGAREGRPFKEYVGHGGARIWVGRGAEDNDALTFKVARPWHLWLHARGVPGSHVVLPLEKGQEVAQEVLLDAAHLALHHSGAKGEPRGEVSYVPAKFVRKVKGGAPGQVTFTREKTFVVRMEPERLERLLKSRHAEPPAP
ncbi:fibronectin/fibrinogen-binding protein [Myxococcus sp. AM009]|uniref:NFACT RNA binding domain-containing protein n=1 Tax=unclassified Myxococcus TaxID=2648731 RepID=UPI001594FE0B|nr:MULTISPECIES: NFACT RNA binding domain-containing protein [unclassified Myxococcus]NVI99010.1 fibronectin/fibrinogen-binding protein [Myxococcus sp. AM009]NVJ16768.1 fibronectin/fibrinogen-binding protein [Myxococcus sp. AM010]